jgi:ParB family chromosome partitioning protein
MTEILIDQIIIGTRRREAMGDMQAMVKSLKRYGLLHPIVLAGNTLVAGHRRLEAARMLGWQMITATDRGEISGQELRALELEENVSRKDLTGYEQSKQWRELERLRRGQEETEQAAANGEVTPHRGAKPQSNPRGGRPKESGSERSAAERMGVGKGTIERHDATIGYGDKYPFMQNRQQDWSQANILKAGKLMDELPQSEQLVPLFSEPGVPPKIVFKILNTYAHLTEPSRGKILDMLRSDTEETRTHAAQILARHEIIRDSCYGTIYMWRESIKQMLKTHGNLPDHQEWLEDLAKNLDQGLRTLTASYKERVRMYGQQFGIDLV